MKQGTTNQSYLKLTRFCGEELYPIESATWHYHKSNNDNMNQLWLEIEAGYGHELSDDTKSLNSQPHWELTFRIENLELRDLKVGFKAEILDGDEDYFGDHSTNFYYCEHESTHNNFVEIIEKQEARILFRLTGEVIDVNYYDGSKPNNIIFVETWFDET